LRSSAGAPSYRLLARKAGYSASALSAAASGAALPSLELTLAYVGACGGDVREWEARWRAASSATAATEPPVRSAPVPAPAVRRPPARPETTTSVFQQLAADDPRRAGGYPLRARIGAGSMGRIYLAYTPGGRALAVKFVRPELAEDPEFRQRFRQEVAAARRVNGLFTAQVVDADTEGRRPWLATAYIPGPSVQEAVAGCGPLSESSLWLFAAGVAEGLQSVRAAGLVHRDLKPSNVLLAADGPRLIDFGIARSSDATHLTRTGMQVGSPQFMAPEHVLGKDVTFAADVFTLGALIVFAATGHSPFGDGVDVAVLYRVVHEAPDLAGMPPPLRALASACLHKDPARRPGLADVIRTCREQSNMTSLKISSSWLPEAHMAEIAHRAAAMPPR
jgi:serine/threonine protein kinase